MPTTQNTVFGDEEDIVKNLSGIIDAYITHNKPVNFVIKHFFYAKCLVAELAKANIPYRVFYLGSGVRHVTTHLDVANPNQLLTNPDRAPALTDQEKHELWLKTFGTAKVRTSAVLTAVKDNPTVAKLFINYPKLTTTALGAALGRLHKTVNWLHCHPTWIPEERQTKFFWYAR